MLTTPLRRVLAATVAVVAVVVVTVASPSRRPATSTPGAARRRHPPPAARPEPHPVTQIGFLTAVRVTDDTVRLTVDRVLWLTGEEARRANHGVEPENGYVIVNQNRRLRTYRLDADAQVLGGDQLGSDGDGSQAEEITIQQLVERAAAAIARGTPPLVNLWHEDSEDTTVVRLVEQYRP